MEVLWLIGGAVVLGLLLYFITRRAAALLGFDPIERPMKPTKERRP